LEKQTAKTIVLIIAILGFIGAGMALLGGLAMVFFGGVFFESMMQGAEVFAVLGGLAGVMLILIGALELWIFYKFLKYANWARIVVIILSVLMLFNFPLGTVLGALYIYFLAFNEDVKKLFK